MNFRLGRDKPYFLFTGTKWLSGNPELGPSSLSTFTYGPLEASGYADYDFFPIDDFFLNYKKPSDEALLALCSEKSPDLFVLVWWPGAADHLNPSLDTLYAIRKKLKIPIVAMWYDTWAKWLVETAEGLLPFVDLAIVSDSISHFHGSARKDKYLNLPPPMDFRVFYDADCVRDIDISFNGGVRPYPDRVSGIQALSAAGIEVLKTGGQLEEPLPLKEYARVFMRSKITLGFNRSGEKITLKGRTFEATLCGAMLLESANNETPKWLQPMVDYVSFSDEQDLVGKAYYYLKNDDERETIAQNGKNKAQLVTDGGRYWRSIFERVVERPSYNEQEALACVISKSVERNNFATANDYLDQLLIEAATGDQSPVVTKIKNRVRPLVSVITICKNSEKTIRRCIESVLGQDYRHFEYIIQDGVSSDRTLDIIRQYRDPRINLVSQPDSGGSEAYVKALQRCNGELITLCWADEELLPHAVGWGVENLAKNPEVGAIYGDVYCSDINGIIYGNSQPAPPWNLSKYLCWEIMPNYCASFMRRKALEESGFLEFTSRFLDSGKTKLEEANCIMYDYFALPGLKHAILHVSGFVGKFSVHGGQLSSTPKVIFGMIPGLLRSIDHICDDPTTPADIRSLRLRAYAGIRLAMINTLIMNAKSYDDAKEMLRAALQYDPDKAFLEKVCSETLCHLLHIEEFSHALEFLSILELSGCLFTNFGYIQAMAYLESGLIDKAQESIKKELNIALDNSKAQALDTKLRDYLKMQAALEAELTVLPLGPQKDFISQLIYFTSLKEHKTLKRLGQIMNAGVSSQSFIDAGSIFEKSLRTPGFLISVRKYFPEACSLIYKTLTAFLYIAVENNADELAKKLSEVLAQSISVTS